MLTILMVMIAFIFMGVFWLLFSPIGGLIILVVVIALVVYKIIKKKKGE